MMTAYRKIERRPEVPVATVMPSTRSAVDAAAHEIRHLSDGRAQLWMNGEPVGIYATYESAECGLRVFQRMGVAR